MDLNIQATISLLCITALIGCSLEKNRSTRSGAAVSAELLFPEPEHLKGEFFESFHDLSTSDQQQLHKIYHAKFEAIPLFPGHAVRSTRPRGGPGGLRTGQMQRLPSQHKPLRKMLRRTINGSARTLIRIELISNLSKAHEAVYLPNPTAPKLLKRGLNEFEQAAVTAFKGDPDHHLLVRDNGLQMVGPLRANKDCRRCHRVRQGQLMGFFVYTVKDQ